MQRWTRIIATILAILLVVTSIFAAVGTFRSEVPEENQAEFQPLPIGSKRVVAKYQGGQLTEDDLNRYINLNAYFDPMLAIQLASPEVKAKMNEIKAEIAQNYATKRFVASKVKVNEAITKKFNQQWKQLEQDMLQSGQFANPKRKFKSIDEAIKGKGFSTEDLRQAVLLDIKIEEYLQKQVDQETFDLVKLNHILISYVPEGQEPVEGQPKRTEAEAKKRALEVKKKLEEGGDFKALAKTYSDDPGSKDNAGYYEADASSFVDPFKDAVLKLPLNQISDPVKTEYGYHIIKVTERKKEKVANAGKDLRQEIQQRRMQEVFDQIRKKEVQFKWLLK